MLSKSKESHDFRRGSMSKTIKTSNGFIGKTIIHPSHINYVNGILAVTNEEYLDACQVLETTGGVIKSENSNKMNEIGPHHLWAEKIYIRSKVYGVIENKQSYLELFGGKEV